MRMGFSQTTHGQIIIGLIASMLVYAAWGLLKHPIIPLVFAVLPFGMLFVISQPFFVCMWFVAFSFLRIHEAFAPLYPLRIPLLLSLASLGVLGWHIVMTEKIKPYTHQVLKIFLIFFILIIIGIAVASDKAASMSYFTGMYIKIAIMTPAIAWMLRSKFEFEMASRIFVIGGIMVGGVANYNKANGIGLVEGTRVTVGRELESAIGDPNDLSLVLLFPLSFAVCLAFGKNVGFWGRLIGILGTINLLMAIIATQSRGGLLGIMAVCGLYAFRRIKNKLIVIAGGGIAVVVLAAAAGLGDRKSGGAAEEGVDESAMGRIWAWGAAWNMAVHKPLTGVGIDNFVANYFFYSSHWDGNNHAVHSTWFGVLAETGFLGFAIFIWFIVTMFRYSIHCTIYLENHPRAPPNVTVVSQAVLYGLTGTCVSGTFLTQGFTWPYYILASFCVAVSTFKDKLEASDPYDHKEQLRQEARDVEEAIEKEKEAHEAQFPHLKPVSSETAKR